jgi:addiction module HigA family antidote
MMKPALRKSDSRDGSVSGAGVGQARPLSPAEVLRDLIHDDKSLTQESVADALGTSRYSVNQLVNGRRGVTAEMALRLSHAFDTSPEFWLNLQLQVDLYDARRRLGSSLQPLPQIRRA